jgi:hypothetical protein
VAKRGHRFEQKCHFERFLMFLKVHESEMAFLEWQRFSKSVKKVTRKVKKGRKKVKIDFSAVLILPQESGFLVVFRGLGGLGVQKQKIVFCEMWHFWSSKSVILG